MDNPTKTATAHHEDDNQEIHPFPSIHRRHSIPPVPPIPHPLPEKPHPTNFRSLSFSKPTILKFEEFPNMNLAFYLDLISPNDLSTLPDSVITSPRQDKERERARARLGMGMGLEREMMDFPPGRKSSLPPLAPAPAPGAKMGMGMGNVVRFSAPGWKTDVKITVFEREFHAHSIVLRLYSGFFRGVCDLVDREGGFAPGRGGFRYEFVAVGVEDEMGGGWTLERVIEKPTTPSPSPMLPPKDHRLNLSQDHDPQPSPHSQEITAFTKLLTAFYSKPFTILSFAELLTLSRLAEQFQALPCLSSALYAALWHSPVLVKEIEANCQETLVLAMRLRHGLLFREALVHVVAGWKGYDAVFDGEYRLICTIVKAYNGVCEKVLRVNGEVFAVLGKGNDAVVREMVCEVLGTMLGECLMGNRGLYENLRQLAESEEGLEGLRVALRELLANKLVLERSLGGAGSEKTGFMCAEIEDEDLPWDVDEEEW